MLSVEKIRLLNYIRESNIKRKKIMEKLEVMCERELPNRQFKAAVDDLYKNIIMVGELTMALREKLRPVMLPDIPSVDGENEKVEKAAPESSPVIHDLRAVCLELNRKKGDLEYLLSRIDY